MRSRVNPFERLRKAVSNTVSGAIARIEKAVQSAVNALEGEAREARENLEQAEIELSERIEGIQEELREQERQAEVYTEDVYSDADEAYGEIDRDEDYYNSLPVSLREWIYATQSDELGREAYETGYQYIREDKVRSYINDNVKVRRSPHGSHESAIEYANDIPRGAVIGITDRGGFWYVIVAGSTNPSYGRGKKRKRRNKRG